MGKEIERKFLVKGDAWKALAARDPLPPGVLNSSIDRTVRVRTDRGSGLITVKGPNNGIARLEFEHVIPADDAERDADMSSPKSRSSKEPLSDSSGGNTSGKWMSFSGRTRGSSSRRLSLEALMSRLRNRSGSERRSPATPATTTPTSSLTRIPSGSEAVSPDRRTPEERGSSGDPQHGDG